MNVMEKCSVCFQTVETDIFIPPDECVKLFNNCLSSLHSSLAENFKNKIPFVYGSQLPLCKMCFDSAFQLNQVNEQLSAFQKQLSDLTVEFSLSVIYRRSQTTAQNTGQKSKIEIDVTGLPNKLFYCKSTEYASHEESRMAEDIESNIIVADQNDVVLRDENIERGSDVRPLEYSVKIEHEDLSEVSNQTSVDEETVKPEHTDSSCDSDAGNNIICSACPGETEDAQCLIGSNIVDMKEHSSTDSDLDEFETDPLSLTEDQPKKIRKITRKRKLSSQPAKSLTKELPKKIRKITRNRILSSQPENIEVVKSKLVANSAICKKRVSKRRLPLSKSEDSHHSQKPLLSHSDGRNKITDRPKLQRITVKDELHSHSFSCEFCQKVFRSKREVLDHIRTHTGERPYQCPLCPKAFKQSAHLAVHKRIHTGERPFKCFYCPKIFNASSNKRAHQILHHGDSREK